MLGVFERIDLSFLCDSSLLRAFKDLMFIQHTLNLLSFYPFLSEGGGQNRLGGIK